MLKEIYKIKEKVAGVERLELPTIGFGDRCSTNWNYTPAMDEHYTQASLKVKHKLLNKVRSLDYSTIGCIFIPLSVILIFICS
jgi:hypothetical protein